MLLELLFTLESYLLANKQMIQLRSLLKRFNCKINKITRLNIEFFKPVLIFIRITHVNWKHFFIAPLQYYSTAPDGRESTKTTLTSER